MGKKVNRFIENFESNMKDIFIEFLDDDDVREKMFSLFREFGEENEKADNSQEIEDLKRQLEEKDRLIKVKDSEIYTLRNRLERTESANNEANETISRLTVKKEELCERLKAEEAKPKFDEKLAEAYSEYNELPQEIREKYGNMLCGDSPVDFVLKGTKYALELHERICMDWNRLDSETLESLNKIFDYIFEQFCVINSGYRRLRVEVGEPFDMCIHTRTADSSPSGVVREVILCGYEKSNGTRAKSLVKVG